MKGSEREGGQKAAANLVIGCLAGMALGYAVSAPEAMRQDASTA